MQSNPALPPAPRPASHRARALAGCLALLVAFGPAAPAWGAGFSSKKFTYHAAGKKLSDVLQDFAASQDLPVIVDPGVAGTVSADFNTRPEEFLNAIARTYGIIWYFDGTTLFVYPSSAMQSRVFRMRGYDRQQVRQLLTSLGLGDARYPLRFDDTNQTLLAYGPPRHIELVSTLVEQLERDGADRVGRSIRVFQLRYASAADRSFGNTKVPGLAKTLNELFAPPSDKSAPAGIDAAVANVVGQPDKVRAAAAGNFGLKLPPVGSGASAAGAAATSALSAQPPAPVDPERPLFQADESTNTVIVRGLPDRMKEYEELIRQLDVPQDLVEIEATIIDVSADEFDSLGVDFNFSNNHVQLGLSSGSPGASPGLAPTPGVGDANITTVISNAGAQLLSRVRALEGHGKAHILARPKVLGVANRVATMADKRVVSIKVAGNLDANLFSIEAGTTLQVTPQILPFADHREVRMSLSIQDGSFEGAVVDSIPVIKQTEIDTEATIREGESLLVGGISLESDSSGISAVPGLSKIPLLGGVFRHTEGSATRSERLFLITPKVIASGGRGATVASASPAPAPAPAAAPAVRQAVSALVPQAATPTPVFAPAPAPAASAAPPPAAECAAQALGLAQGCPASGGR